MSKKQRKTYGREFKKEAVALINEKGYSMAEASHGHAGKNQTPGIVLRWCQ